MMHLCFFAWHLAESAVQKTSAAIYNAVASVLYRPAKWLYLHGPAASSFGGWRGLPPSEICAKLSPGTTGQFWQRNKETCEAQIDQHALAFSITLYGVMCGVLIYFGIHMFWYYLCVVRPLTNSMNLSQLVHQHHAHMHTRKRIQ